MDSINSVSMIPIYSVQAFILLTHHIVVHISIFIMMKFTGEGRACIQVGPTMVTLTEQSVFVK